MKKSAVHDTIIIGGGLSGLSAAVELTGRGASVLVCEKSSRLGGRTSSFVDETTGELVDNGQHLLMGCYSATRRYLQVIGAEHLADLQENLRIPYLRPGFEPVILDCPHLPSLLHTGLGLLGFSAIPLADKLGMVSVIKELLLQSNPKDLDALTVKEWLTRLKQSDASKKYLWDVICIGALNNLPEHVSASVFFRVLKEIFLWKRENSCFLLPRAALSELLIDPAVEYIRSHGGEILTNVHIEDLQINGNEITSALCSDGTQITAPSYISAVPWYAVNALCPSKTMIEDSAFRSAPIVNIHVWFDGNVMKESFAALVGTKIQWLFNVSLLLKNNDHKDSSGQHISCVLSGAEDYVQLSKEQLIEIALNDLRAVLPAARNASIIHWLVVKEKRATFIPAPGLDAKRPSAKTQLRNFFLAGDWTNTGFPATIEGAVRSGIQAAQAVKNQELQFIKPELHSREFGD